MTASTETPWWYERNIEVLGTAQNITFSSHIDSAQNISVNLIPSANAENGSVHLAGVLLTMEPTPRLPFARPATAEHQFFTSERPQTRPQLPLWKRLAYLLQPPTELLLAKSGPLQWPGTLFVYQLEGIHALMSHEALLLADDMGLGKTVLAVDYCCACLPGRLRNFPHRFH